MPPEPAPPPAGGQGGALNTASKKNRQLMMIGGVVVAALVFVLSRGQSQPETPVQQQGQTLDPGSVPTTFADNGAQAAALGDTVTSGLGAVATSLEGLGTSFRDLSDVLTASEGTPGVQSGTGNPAVNVTINNGQPANKQARASGKAKAKTGAAGAIKSPPGYHVPKSGPYKGDPHYRVDRKGQYVRLTPARRWVPVKKK